MTSHCSKNAVTRFIQVGFWPDLLSWSFKTDPIFSRFLALKIKVYQGELQVGHFLKISWFFMFLALIPPGLVNSLVSTPTAFLPPCVFDIGATFLKLSLCRPELWSKITPRERPYIQQNAICENTGALFYKGEWDSAINNWAPEVAIYRLGPFSPPAAAEFFINFSWNFDRCFETKKFLWKAALCSRYKSKKTSWECSSFDV